MTEVEDLERNKTILRVEGEMMYDDAVLLEKIALAMRADAGKNLTIDLADLDLLDSDGASILVRLEREHGFELEGVEFFLQNVIDETEKRQS